MRDLRRRRKNQPCVLCGEFCEDACSAMRASIRRSASRAAAVIDEPAHQVLVRPRLLRNHPGRRGLDALSGRHRGRLLRNDKERSTFTNAWPHRDQASIASIDIRDFYPNVDFNKVYRLWGRLGLGPKLARILTKLTTTHGCLPQGAPSTPRTQKVTSSSIA